MRTPLAYALAALSLAAPALTAAQEDWRAYPAYNEVVAVASSDDGVWAGTSAGLFFYGVPDGEVVTYTPVGALRGGPLGALAVDDARGVVWVGYEDGLLERLDPGSGEVAAFYDLTRADQFASRGIRDIGVAGDVLYLATDFGVVVFDAARGVVRSTYARIGTLSAGAPVNDVVEAPRPDGGPGLWVATEGGVFYADRAGANLQAPGAWTRADGLDGEALSLALLDGALYAGGGPAGARDLYRARPGGGWDRVLFIDDPVPDLAPAGDRLYAVTPFAVHVVRPGRPSPRYVNADVRALRAVTVGPGGAVWAGDAAAGLLRLPASDAADGPIPYELDRVLPPGPLTNSIVGIDVGRGGVLWAVTRRLDAAQTAAAARLDGGTWTNFLTRDPALDISRNEFRSASVGPDGRFYAGAEGGGLTVFDEDGTPTTYDETNSSLQGEPGDASYVVVPDVAFEGDRRWVLNQFSSRPLHLFAADGTWTGLPFPSPIPSTARPVRVAVDGFGQKWIALAESGLGVVNTGDDPADPRDDRGGRFTRQNGLPDPTVTDVVVDGQGRVWAGTERGVATAFNPGAAIGGDPGISVPVISDGADFFFRDVRVNDLEVDPAGRVWIATTSGAFLVNEAGNDVVLEVRSGTSPLPSDDVLAVAVDPSSGRVFLTTSEGLFSFAGDATAPDLSSDGLRMSPNPFRPDGAAGGVLVTGLAAERSDVRVMTAAGDVVWAGEVAGGAFRWDGRDQRTGRPVPSGVYLVAAAGEGGRTVYGKMAVIR